MMGKQEFGPLMVCHSFVSLDSVVALRKIKELEVAMESYFCKYAFDSTTMIKKEVQYYLHGVRWYKFYYKSAAGA